MLKPNVVDDTNKLNVRTSCMPWNYIKYLLSSQLEDQECQRSDTPPWKWWSAWLSFSPLLPLVKRRDGHFGMGPLWTQRMNGRPAMHVIYHLAISLRCRDGKVEVIFLIYESIAADRNYQRRYCRAPLMFRGRGVAGKVVRYSISGTTHQT